jgi:hypothetical protein
MCHTETKTPPAPSSGPDASVPACGPTPCPITHAALMVKELTFGGTTPVEKDTLGNFVPPEWEDGRVPTDQAPVRYTRNLSVSISAKFRITKQPSAGESVLIRATATFGSVTLQWSGTVSVSPGDTEATLPMTASSGPLADQVDCFDASPIQWEMNPASQGWSGAGETRNIVYVTLADPSATPAYWTLLDISCRAAAGDMTVAALVAHAFGPFTSRSLNRKRDNQPLTYWNPDTTTVTNTHDLLAAGDGSGQCGSWSEFFIDMLKAHGITDAHKILIVRDKGRSIDFLVKNWRFNHPPASASSAFTHKLNTECVKQPGIPGQNNPNPPPAFQNHFIVLHGGLFYDPSYGAGPVPNQLSWESGAIDGLTDGALAGFDKSLNFTTRLLEFWDLNTGKKI